MKLNFKLIKEELPKKGKDIIGINENGEKFYCFRCACNNKNCKEWRSSITGSMIIANIKKWIYDEYNN